MPLAVVWAVLAFVTNYIPNIGFILGLVPAAVMGLLAKGPWGAVFVIVLYAVLNFVIQGVIQPKVAGEAVGVTSTVSFLSLLVWAVVLGPLGALLALPATLFVKALVVDADPRARWLNALIASNPKTSAEEPVLAEPAQGELVPAGEGAPVPAPADEVVPETGTPTAPAPATEPAVDEGTVTEPVEEARRAEVPEPEAGAGTDLTSAPVEGAEPAAEVATREEPAADEEAPTPEPAEAPRPEDRPRRARLDQAPYVDDETPADDLPVFQKSATPYWPGAMSHADD
ncbi:MAG TPA: AI-2E family transporter [Propionibacteriaceae bacterium]|nr:AI-2E family transporter [Propionibacteriaceae bacterium]